ncbi:conidial yellow pigment biosynthesis polyketide synthase [Trichoderma arundinaceum]|uniref:Conidial yellow pigment biosynthesis polyketide synthase n=1 Tax=Trichoderma arundinaceum TaxID=490622 RepID=A0A395NM10_TRIAR|nr:conidial yellow pigment biosynthesis polyketide synthase [Trichoderma arundinaceum]
MAKELTLYLIGDQTCGSNAYSGSGKHIVIGIFTGVLAAAAISCSHSVMDLVPLAVDAVVVAFHTGVRVAELPKRIAPFGETDQGWSISIPDIAAVEAVELFQSATLRWDINTHVDPGGPKKNTSRTPFGCCLEDPAVFDAGFFNIFQRTVPQIDPAQRLALMTTYEAMGEAGMVLDATPSTRRDRISVF